jgi:hypothetical protein
MGRHDRRRYPDSGGQRSRFAVAGLAGRPVPIPALGGTGRRAALGVHQLWRDSGYAVGALIGGVTAALASLDATTGAAAVLTAASGLLAWAFMTETHPRLPGHHCTRNPGQCAGGHLRAGESFWSPFH